MDRQAHEYAAAMAFAQQQQQAASMQQHQHQHQHQQFGGGGGGFPPQPQFSSQAPPFLAPSPHHSLQQFPYHHHLQQQQQQLHPPPHHLAHLQQQQQQFPPHMPPHLVSSSPFHNPYDSAPPPSPPPSDPELHKVIDKLVEYAAKNGPEFEAMIREKQRDNPAYAFLFGGEGHNYYRYKLWISTRPTNLPFPQSFPSSSLHVMHPLPLNSPPGSGPVTHLHQSSFPPFYDQQHHSLPFPSQAQARSDHESSTKSFKGLSGPLPSDVASELGNVLTNLTGTKESIKGAKMWFMQRSPFAPALAEALRERVLALEDSERQLHIVFLANDILFDSLQRRINPRDLDNEALAFKPVLGSMLARIYHNPHNQEANQSRLQKILQFWASKEVYDPDTIYSLEDEMIRRPPSGLFSGSPNDLSANSADQTNFAGMTQSTPPQGLNQWQSDRQRSSGQNSLDPEQSEKQMPPAMMNPSSQFALAVGPPFHPNSGPSSLHAPVTTASFVGSLPIQSPVQPSHQLPLSHLMPSATTNIGEKLPPYPLFPPGLIPGMVRKMQIGSGVPYSPMSPLDIPTVIPPSTASPSDVLERVSKFFKVIGEVNPSEGPMKSPNSSDDDNDYNRESPIRKGGACIPPPPNLQLDPETGTYADGSVERKPGSSSSGRLGLGATADPNEISQYDDVYSSYRKQRSTNYHSSMSARAAAR